MFVCLRSYSIWLFVLYSLLSLRGEWEGKGEGAEQEEGETEGKYWVYAVFFLTGVLT